MDYFIGCCLLCHIDIQKGQPGKYYMYVTLGNWLRSVCGIDRSDKAVNAKVKQIEAEYSRKLKVFQARKAKAQCDTLNTFLDSKFQWQHDMRKGKKRDIGVKNEPSQAVENCEDRQVETNAVFVHVVLYWQDL